MQVRVVPIRAGRVHIRQYYVVLVAFARKNVYQNVIRGGYQLVRAFNRVRPTVCHILSGLRVFDEAARRYLKTVKVEICMRKARWFGRIYVVSSGGAIVLRERRHLVKQVVKGEIYRRSFTDVQRGTR